MSDQVTTVATLPAGYPTFAGVIYAIVTTSPTIWSNTAWARMAQTSLSFPRNTMMSKTWRSKPDTSQKIESHFKNKLTRQVTDNARHRRFGQDGQAAEKQAVVLHLAHGYMAATSGSTINDVESASGTTTPTGLGSADATLEKREPRSHCALIPAHPCPSSHSIAFQVVTFDASQRTTTTTVAVSLSDLKGLIDEYGQQAFECPSHPLLVFLHSPFPRTVSVQLGASAEAFMVEFVYKAIEMLVACGVILGSTGGAWLGLTLGSMFPTRVAAGVYSSAFGQMVPPETPTHAMQQFPNPHYNRVGGPTSGRHLFRAAGTVWGGTYPEVKPAGMSDELRTAIGYCAQFAVLLVVHQFKGPIRQALEFGSYAITRDAVRYIVLVVEFFALIACGRSMFTRWKGKAKISTTKSNIFCLVVYVCMLCACLTCVIIGNKNFLKPIWKFYLVSKIVQPLAAVGSIAVMKLAWRLDGEVNPEKWVLLWAIGACTVVW